MAHHKKQSWIQRRASFVLQGTGRLLSICFTVRSIGKHCKANTVLDRVAVSSVLRCLHPQSSSLCFLQLLESESHGAEEPELAAFPGGSYLKQTGHSLSSQWSIVFCPVKIPAELQVPASHCISFCIRKSIWAFGGSDFLLAYQRLD